MLTKIWYFEAHIWCLRECRFLLWFLLHLLLLIVVRGWRFKKIKVLTVSKDRYFFLFNLLQMDVMLVHPIIILSLKHWGRHFTDLVAFLHLLDEPSCLWILWLCDLRWFSLQVCVFRYLLILDLQIKFYWWLFRLFIQLNFKKWWLFIRKMANFLLWQTRLVSSYLMEVVSFYRPRFWCNDLIWLIDSLSHQ